MNTEKQVPWITGCKVSQKECQWV